MSARDDFGSDAGRPGGKGGSNGGLANGGVGGGRGGGGGGGGAGRNGGYGSQTGLNTGNVMYGGIAKGRPGQNAWNPGAWGIRPGPSVQQSALNRPAVPGLLSPVQPPAVPQAVPPAPYDPLVSLQVPPPATYFMAGRVLPPNMYDYAVQKPGAHYAMGSGYYNNPYIGSPGAGGSGLGNYSNYNQGSALDGKGDLGGPVGGMVGHW